MNKSILAGIIIGASLVPFAASAISVSDLQAQIQALLKRISSLQSQLDSGQAPSDTSASEPTSVGGAPAAYGFCREGYFPKLLRFGVRGDDVLQLQTFLHNEGLLSAEPTGYFGSATEAALGSWQLKQGVVSSSDRALGWGVYGPRTSETIRRWCVGGGGYSSELSAYPQSGVVPLTVNFSAGNLAGSEHTYSIDFGDGTSGAMNLIYPPCAYGAKCLPSLQTTHIYTSNGTYTATLHENYRGGCTPEAEAQGCLGSPASKRVVGQATIRVGSAVGCTKEYRPVCGRPNKCTEPNLCGISAPQTYSNRCLMAADGATYLYEGVCRDDSVGGNRPPVISSFSGPTSLDVNEQGTWRISASDPENGSLTYSVIWGDEWYSRDASTKGTTAAASIMQQTTFTHSYAREGVYTVRLTVTDGGGKSNQSSATVRVGNPPTAVCPPEYTLVCGRPRGCANTCPAGMYCTLECRLHNPVTYTSRCQMNAASADYLHLGACRADSGNPIY